MTPTSRGAHPGPRRRTVPAVTRRRAILTLAAPALALVAACGGASSGTGTSATPSVGNSPAGATGASYPTTVTAANGKVTIEAQPKRIVSLGPTATEMLYAIGAGSQVAAVDSLSDHPSGAPKTTLSAFHPNTEAVAGYDPDLVVLDHDANGVVKSLSALGVPVLLLPAAKDLADSYAQETTLGVATGHPDGAAKVVRTTKERIAAAVASVPKASPPLSVYHEISQTYYSATSSTFIGSVYSMFGLKNIADGAGNAASTGGYPQLSAEYVVSSAPDLIVLADGKCCGQSPATVAKRSAFADVPAVKNHRVVAIDDAIASRWGPRTADFAESVAKVLGDK